MNRQPSGKKKLGTVEYRPFSELPEVVVSSTVEEDRRDLHIQQSRRNRAKKQLGPKLFDDLSKKNEQLRYDVSAKYQKKEKEKERVELSILLAKIEKEEQEKEERQRKKEEFEQKRLEKRAQKIAELNEMEQLWFSEDTPRPKSPRSKSPSKKKSIPRWIMANGGKKRRSKLYKSKHIL
jgi:hypothetical protein